MKAWWVVVVGLGLAVAGALALLSSDVPSPRREVSREPSRASEERPLGEIRDDSRAAMRDLLRDAEDERP